MNFCRTDYAFANRRIHLVGIVNEFQCFIRCPNLSLWKNSIGTNINRTIFSFFAFKNPNGIKPSNLTKFIWIFKTRQFNW